MEQDLNQIIEDLKALSGVTDRFAGTEGERSMLQAVRARVPNSKRSKIEGFVANVSPARWTAFHTTVLFFAAGFGYFYPLTGAMLCAIITLSLVGEGIGWFRLMRFLAPKWPSYNLVLRNTPESALGAVVLVTPLDLPMWRPFGKRAAGFRPMQVVVTASLFVTVLLVLRAFAEPWGKPSGSLYILALGVFAVSALISGFSHKNTKSREDPGGAATVLELVRRFDDCPLPNTQLWVVFTGCGHAFQGGIRHFFSLHGGTIPDPVLVLALDDTGRAPLLAATHEGPLLSQAHRPTGPALVERLRWAGVRVPEVQLNRATDARAATLLGYRALSFVGGDSEVTPEGVGNAADVVETVIRWYSDDLAQVASRAADLAELSKATQKRREPVVQEDDTSA